MLRHRYWVCRHGESAPNVDGIIVSRPARGLLPECGLTAAGRAQAAVTAAALRGVVAPGGGLVYSSDFSRAVETAGPLAEALGCGVSLSARLRERDFGELEGKSSTLYPGTRAVAPHSPCRRRRRCRAASPRRWCHRLLYADVWREDALDAAHTAFGVESVESVAARALAVIADVEAAHAASPPRDVFLVAHGDVLQILQAALGGRDLRAHRSLPHLHNAEARRVHAA